MRTALLAAFVVAGCFPDRSLPDDYADTDSGPRPDAGGKGEAGAGAGGDGGGGGAGGGGAGGGGEGGKGGMGGGGNAANGGSPPKTPGGGAGGRGGSSGGGMGGETGAGKGVAGSAGESGKGVAGSAGESGRGAAGVSGGGGAAGQPPPACYSFADVANIETSVPPEGAWGAGSEKRSDTADDVQHFLCEGAGGPGKAIFGFGCYMPVGIQGLKQVTNVRILKAPKSNCLDWRPHASDQRPPPDALQLPIIVCRAAVTNGQTNITNVLSTGTHLGQVQQASGGRFVCLYEFYTRVLEADSYDILIELPR